MTKKLEKLLDLAPNTEPFIGSTPVDVQPVPTINLQEKLEEFDKISAALPRVKGLGDISDAELDALANKAEQAYDDLMDLGMNVDPRYGARMFEVAANMMTAAINAKSAKIDKKLKMVDLQLKKLAIDKKHAEPDNNTIEGQGFIISDRNSILEKLKSLNK
jgi:DNA repair exonuclease SbcCD ATPase subunit